MEVQRLLSVAALLLLIGVFAKLVHLAFLHPLAKYPGPFLARFTNFYPAYHGWKGDIHLDMWRCHQKYGDYVRYGPNQLLMNTVQALHDVHGLSSASNFIKAKTYTPLVHRSPNTLTIKGGKDHARRRRILAQGVSEKAQRSYERRITTHIDRFCAAMFDGSGPRDMSKWCYYLSFDIMSDVVFGARYDLLQSDQFRYVTSAIDASNVRMSTLIQYPDFAALSIDRYLFPSAIVARRKFVAFVSSVIRERLAKSKQKGSAITTVADDDVFAQIAKAKDPETGQGFRDSEITAESTTLIVAGSDTSSTGLSALFFYLATNREPYQKAAKEVRNAFQSREEIIMGAALSSCTYLRACIDESLRISPPVGSSLWREVLSPGAVVDGESIPGGCDVGTSIYAIHHDSRYFTNPYQYLPERWLVDDGTGSIERARSAFNPFSLGIRGCLGKGIAMTEIMLVFATVLYNGDFELAPGELGEVGRGRPGAPYGRHRVNEYQHWDYITAQKQGPFLEFTRR